MRIGSCAIAALPLSSMIAKAVASSAKFLSCHFLPSSILGVNSDQGEARERDAMLILDFQFDLPLGFEASFRIDDVGDQARPFVELDQRDVVGELRP